jgi:NADH:ubiquinone oxidoreductase subunit 3 (subunit A)
MQANCVRRESPFSKEPVMSELFGLWLPIIAAAAVGHIASAIAWIVMPHHKPEWRRIPNEDQFLDAVRSGKPAPGQYMFPYCEWSDMKDPEKKARYEAGPHGTLNVWRGAPNMNRNMFLTFVYFLVANVFIAYITSLALDPGAHYLTVFQIAGTAAIMAYCFASIPNAIWFGKPLRAVCTDLLDGIVYGLLTAGIYGWLWPR